MPGEEIEAPADTAAIGEPNSTPHPRHRSRHVFGFNRIAQRLVFRPAV
jgi:hypothetical protein